ncbi:MAG: hypothetical protein H0U43_08515, partial [Chthoniobacterales bacterium]|nr:hypothetical protein [Chthoniobacterales bacterium]
MKIQSVSQAAFLNVRILLGFVFCSVAVLLVLIAFGLSSGGSVSAQAPTAEANSVKVGRSYKNDVSRPVREMPAWSAADGKSEHEANENPKVPHRHVDSLDPVIQSQHAKQSSSTLGLIAPSVAAAINNFDGIPFPGVGCNCAPPDTNGAVGRTQFVQIVNEGYQVFDKSTTASV